MTNLLTLEERIKLNRWIHKNVFGKTTPITGMVENDYTSPGLAMEVLTRVVDFQQVQIGQTAFRTWTVKYAPGYWHNPEPIATSESLPQAICKFARLTFAEN